MTDTLIFHSFFSSLARLRYISIFLFPFIFLLWSTGMTKSTRRQILFILLINTWSRLLAWIRWSGWILKSQRILCVWVFKTDTRSVWSEFSLFHHSKWITFSIWSFQREFSVMYQVSRIGIYSVEFCWIQKALDMWIKAHLMIRYVKLRVFNEFTLSYFIVDYHNIALRSCA